MFCVGFGMLGGILRRLVVAGGTTFEPPFCLSKCWEGNRVWEDNEEEEVDDDDDDDCGWSLAWETLHQTESINETAKRTAVNDLLMDFMVLVETVYLDVPCQGLVLLISLNG